MVGDDRGRLRLMPREDQYFSPRPSGEVVSRVAGASPTCVQNLTNLWFQPHTVPYLSIFFCEYLYILDNPGIPLRAGACPRRVRKPSCSDLPCRG